MLECLSVAILDRSTIVYPEVTCLKTRKTPADQGFYAFSDT